MQRGLTTMCLLLIAISLHSWSMVANWKFSIMLKFFLANGETPVWSCGLQFHRNFPSLKNDVLTKRHMGCRLVFKKVGNRLCRLHFETWCQSGLSEAAAPWKHHPSVALCDVQPQQFGSICVVDLRGPPECHGQKPFQRGGNLNQYSQYMSHEGCPWVPQATFFISVIYGHSILRRYQTQIVFPMENLYINVPLNVKLRYAVDEEEERVPMTIPRRVPHGDVCPGGLPFRLWCLMTILSQASGFGSTLGYVKYDAKLGIPRNLYDLFNMWDVKSWLIDTVSFTDPRENKFDLFPGTPHEIYICKSHIFIKWSSWIFMIIFNIRSYRVYKLFIHADPKTPCRHLSTPRTSTPWWTCLLAVPDSRKLSPSMGIAHAHWISAVMNRTTLVWWVHDKFPRRLAQKKHPTASYIPSKPKEKNTFWANKVENCHWVVRVIFWPHLEF